MAFPMNRIFALIVSGPLLFASGAALSDEALLNALRDAGVPMTDAVADDIEAAEDQAAITDAIEALIASLGDDGAAIADAVSVAVSTYPQYALEIFSSALAVAPASLTSALAGAAIEASPANAAALTTAAVAANPTQVDAIVASAKAAAPGQDEVIDAAAAAVLQQSDPQDVDSSDPSPS